MNAADIRARRPAFLLTWWELVVASLAVLAATVAVWVTLEADFLAYPGWLAAQKADFILGPVFVGLYWLRMRPESRFGPLLIGFGFVGAVYILQSSSAPALFGTGVAWEGLIYLGNLALILTFPTGRLDGLAAKLIMLAGVAVTVVYVVVVLLVPQIGPDGSISGCLMVCPDNGVFVASAPSLAADLTDVRRFLSISTAIATAALLIWRLLKGTPPQRRALAIGAPIALVFTAAQIAYQGVRLVAPDAAVLEAVQWALAGARSLIWYGFLFALIAAQLFAGRALHRLVRQSLRRPSRGELEAMLREPLGDPGLRLAFWDAETRTFPDPDREGVALRPPGPGRSVTVVERDGRPAAAIVHDAQLADDPELLQAAGAGALLAAENATLDAAWNHALRELRESRARIVTAGDNERQKLERNLHDGVQQRLVSVRIDVELAGELAEGDSAVRDKLDAIGTSVDEAIDELREVAHGLYPPALRQYGLVNALEHVRRHVIAPVSFSAEGFGRHPAELESALYYCCVEAIQNATKHGGARVRVAVVLRGNEDELRFEVSDDGPGFDSSAAHDGMGLQNMRDRLGALDGRLTIVTSAGHGTIVSGSIPLRRAAVARSVPGPDAASPHRPG